MTQNDDERPSMKLERNISIRNPNIHRFWRPAPTDRQSAVRQSWMGSADMHVLYILTVP